TIQKEISQELREIDDKEKKEELIWDWLPTIRLRSGIGDPQSWHNHHVQCFCTQERKKPPNTKKTQESFYKSD
uniref:hypothetical protein n=1 Tax=Salmonella enterica TaxID=28901 RepID=UPI003297F9A6